MKKLLKINLLGMFVLGLMVVGAMHAQAQAVGHCSLINDEYVVYLPDQFTVVNLYLEAELLYMKKVSWILL